MKKLGIFKNSLLMSAVALSVLASPANAVSEEVVRAYWVKKCRNYPIKPENLTALMALDDAQWQQFQKTALSFLIMDMETVDRFPVIGALAKVPPEKLFHDKFAAIAKSLITANLNGSSRAIVFEALGKVPPEKLFHDKFVAIAKSLMTVNMCGKDRVKVIGALGQMSPEQWIEFAKTARSLMTTNLCGEDRGTVFYSLGAIPPEKWIEFVSIAQSLMTTDMNGGDRVMVIEALGRVPPEHLFHENFISTIQPLMTEDASGEDRAWMIEALGEVPLENLFHESFISTIQPFMTEDMWGEDRSFLIGALGDLAPEQWIECASIAQSFMTADMNGNDRFSVVTSLAWAPPEQWIEFAKTAQSLITADMNGKNRAKVIGTLHEILHQTLYRNVENNETGLDNYSQIKGTERVYGQIQRLMRSTNNKIHLTEMITIIELIERLGLCNSDEIAAEFTTVLIQRVNRVEGNVGDDALLTHINIALERVQGTQLQDLLGRQTQSTHKKEVHASVAASVKCLEYKYKDQLQADNILSSFMRLS